ncbi:RNA polymerase-binding protein DksA [Ramlibacter montanisoli]|uniref:RNA polymerase-binding transcription factor DksA n=1 Tax=Ramlibacter montanisoli TaxID=2732512 RepID=A0A849K6M4_9BURK|nr:RNA polymerase-binding protein DksA [Ramlibacter montanisoli]NNU44062.1 RNA polymerase-binding protein DksA [Ramlibacter montanisoli]
MKAQPKVAAKTKKPAAKAKTTAKSSKPAVKAAKPAAKAPAKKSPAKPVPKTTVKAGKPAAKAKKPVAKAAGKTPAKAPAKPAKTAVKTAPKAARTAAGKVVGAVAKAVVTGAKAVVAAAKKIPAKASPAPAKAAPAAKASPPPAATAAARAQPAPASASAPQQAQPAARPAPPPAANAPAVFGSAKATYTPMANPSVLTPPPVVAIKKDPKLANNWKTKSAEELSDAEVLAMPDSEYMNEKQMAYFRLKLLQLKTDILNSAGETTEHLREETVIVPDPADRATIEEEHALELRTRDRERKLLKKIEQSIARIDAGDYGYCDETGEPIGVGRLLARPTATLSLEAQQRRELKQKMFGD